MKTLTALFAVLLLSLVVAMPASAQQESEWRFENWHGPSVPVRMFVPENVTPDTKIVIVMHGNSRDAPRYFRDWVEQGAAHGLIVVVPEFGKAQFKGSAQYHLGFVFDPDTGKRRPEEKWTFSSIEPLFDEVVERVAGSQSSYVLYGHSAGSQFVHRYLYYKPEARVSRYIAANAGWYTLPINDFKYPYGLTDAGIDDAALADILAKPLVILLGSDDVDENDEDLRKTIEAQKQGPNRLARGRTMYRVAEARAEELGVDFNWQLFLVDGADHNNAKMVPAAAAIAAY